MDDIDVVQVLLHDLVAANPDIGIPVALLPFHVAPFRVTAVALLDHRRADPIAVCGHNVADLAVLNLPNRFDVLLLRPALSS